MQRPAVLASDFRRIRTQPDASPALHDHQRRHRTPNAATLPSPVITASMREVERIVTRLAHAHDTMPNNPILGELTGGRGRSAVLRALRRLETAQLILVERLGNRRRVHVIATGRVTDWGEARPGHSPYIHRPPGDTSPKVRVRKPRRPESRPMAAALPPKPILHALTLSLVSEEPRRRHREPEPCNFPLWGDGERPGRVTRPGMYCPVLTDGTGSLCAEHAALCFVPRKNRAGAAPRLAEAA